LAYFLSSAIPSEAKEAGKPPILLQTVPQDFTGPAAAQQSQNRTPDQPVLAPDSSVPPKPPSDAKSGDGASTANSVAIVAKLALDTNNETVKRIEAFYSSAIQQFSTNMQLLLALVAGVVAVAGFFGFASVKNIANETARKTAEETLQPYEKRFSELGEKSGTLTSELLKVKDEFEKFRLTAAKNLHSLRSTMLAVSYINVYIENISKAPDDKKWEYEHRRQDARLLIIEVLNVIQPDDNVVLSQAHAVYGMVLYYDNEFELALDALRKAVEQDPNNSRAAFNLACCACKAADAVDPQAAHSRDRTTSLENEALASLKRFLVAAPWRQTEVQKENDFRRLRGHSHFEALFKTTPEQA